MEKPPIQIPQQEKKQLRTDKLFDATDLEGNKNELLFEVVDRVNEELSKFSEFIGVFPFGSQTKGYNQEGSDVDTFVLYEKWTKDLYRVIEGIKAEYEAKGIEVHIVESTFNDWVVEGKEHMFIKDAACILWRQGRGPKIEFWRDKVRKTLMNIPSEKQDDCVAEIVSFLSQYDEKSTDKIEYRVEKFDKKEWSKQRNDLWKKRMRSLIFKNEEK
jgi:predicted nucleotidyltransferase